MSESSWWSKASWLDLRDWIQACQREVGQIFSEAVRAPYRPYTQEEFDALPDTGSPNGANLQTFTVYCPCPSVFEPNEAECKLLGIVQKTMVEKVLPGFKKQTLSNDRVARIVAVNTEVQMVAGLHINNAPPCSGMLVFRVLCLMTNPVAN